MSGAHFNLALGWLWILLGFVSGAALGMFFHREEWLGGYSSLTRRLYRLGHIAFFALGALNILFFFTFDHLPASAFPAESSAALAIGTVTMPLCCFLMAHWRGTRLLFSIPVLSLVASGFLTVAAILKTNL